MGAGWGLGAQLERAAGGQAKGHRGVACGRGDGDKGRWLLVSGRVKP